MAGLIASIYAADLVPSWFSFWPVFQGAARAYLAASPLQGSGSFPRCYFGVLQYAYYPIALSFQGPLISFIGQMFDIQAAALDGAALRNTSRIG